MGELPALEFARLMDGPRTPRGDESFGTSVDRQSIAMLVPAAAFRDTIGSRHQTMATDLISNGTIG